MANVFDVAKHVLNQMGIMSTWKLQKLCYYAQAWQIAWTDRPLFQNRIEAWQNGPVCPDLFHVHKGQYYVKASDIPESYCDSRHPLTEDEIDTIDRVIKHYGAKEPYELREMTHSEDPWKKARSNIPEGDACSNEITQDSMGEYYGSL